jgi:uncharacterized membrane protein
MNACAEALKEKHGIVAFIVQETALVALALTCLPHQKAIDALNAAYRIGRHRTVEQDLAFGIRQIVDMAIKALSPEVSDTSTAVMCVDYLTSILARQTGRQFPLVHRFEGDALCLVVIIPGYVGLLAEAFLCAGEVKR